MSYQRKRSVSVNDRGHVVGEDHHRSRLSDHEVDLIRELRTDGMNIDVIARKFDLPKGTVSKYCSGSLRGHLAVEQKLLPRREPRFRPARSSDFDEFP